MAQATVSAKGWVVIPAEVRRRHGIRPGQRLRVVDYDGIISLIPEMRDPIREAMGKFKGKRSLVRALLREHEAEVQHDERRASSLRAR